MIEKERKEGRKEGRTEGRKGREGRKDGRKEGARTNANYVQSLPAAGFFLPLNSGLAVACDLYACEFRIIVATL